MVEVTSPGARFRAAVEAERPLQVVGVINAYSARLAEATGYQALYVSGGGVAAASCGVPDIGITTLDDVLTDVGRITAVSSVPLLVDIDTGWGGPENIAYAVQQMINAGAAAVHIEDQVEQKRCGHLPGKSIVPARQACERIMAAVDARDDNSFVIMARTDALAVEGIEAAVQRACDYVDAGAEMIFPDAITELDQYRRFVDATGVPVLANITEFGKTPMFTTQQLADVGVALVLYPLSAFRAMSRATLKVYQALRQHGTQRGVIEMMQNREELYNYLGYDAAAPKGDEQLDQDGRDV